MATVFDSEITPLQTGDQLSRTEFERRYEVTPNIKKAELIEGVVYVAPPGQLYEYGVPCARLIAWLGLYRGYTPGVIGAAHPSTRLDLDNEFQPESVLFIDPAKGGQARISADDFLESAPEFVAEVSSSSVSYDLDDKLKAYRRNGVCEYIVWRVRDRQIDWFVLKGGKFLRLRLDKSGVYRSRIFPGLWLNPAALIRDDTKALVATLRLGLASPEHAAFVARLNPHGKP